MNSTISIIAQKGKPEHKRSAPQWVSHEENAADADRFERALQLSGLQCERLDALTLAGDERQWPVAVLAMAAVGCEASGKIVDLALAGLNL